MVRCCVVNDIDVRVGYELAIIAVRALDVPLRSAAPRGFAARARESHHLDVAQATHRLDVLGGDEARTYQTHLQSFQFQALAPNRIVSPAAPALPPLAAVHRRLIEL